MWKVSRAISNLAPCRSARRLTLYYEREHVQGVIYSLAGILLGAIEPMNILRRLIEWLCPEPVMLAIVRRYQDANGAYVGELYMRRVIARKTDPEPFSEYVMIGASLDTLPLEIMDPMMYTDHDRTSFCLDVRNDFLQPMPPDTVRVGGLTPDDDLRIRREIYALRRRPIDLIVQNRFIEHILEPKEQGQ